MRRFFGILITMLLFWVGAGYYISNQFRLRDTLAQTRQDLISVAANAALAIDAQKILEVPLVASGDSSLAYQELSDKLAAIKQANPRLKYVYIMAATDKPGILQYVADADPAPQVITAQSPRALPGDRYDAIGLPAMLRAYDYATADQQITADEWGAVFSGYAPIKDNAGNTVAILGVDIDAGRIAALQKQARASGFWALGGFFIFLVSLFATLVFKSNNTE